MKKIKMIIYKNKIIILLKKIHKIKIIIKLKFNKIRLINIKGYKN